MTMTHLDAALLNSEWAASFSIEQEPCCPSCNGIEPTTTVLDDDEEGRKARTIGGTVIPRDFTESDLDHRPGCVHDLSLAERGYPTQVERNAARARLKAANEPTIPPPASGTR